MDVFRVRRLGGSSSVRSGRRLKSVFFSFKQKSAYEMRISDWSSDVCSSDLPTRSLPATFFISRKTARKRFITWLLALTATPTSSDRKSVVKGQSVPVRVDLGGHPIIKTKIEQLFCTSEQHTTRTQPRQQ